MHGFQLSFFNLNILLYPLTVIGIVWCINLYNFMDGIDALAGLEGIFLMLVAALAFFFENIYSLSSLCFLLSLAISGFLFWNWPPAKIFMGDSGSCFLGFIFAVLALYSSNQYQFPIYFWASIGALFICDTTLTLLYRIYQKKPWYEAHHDHAYQALLSHGLSHENVAIGALLVNLFILAPTALILLNSRWKFSLALISLFVAILIWFLFMKLKYSMEKI